MAFTKQVFLFFAITALCDHLVVGSPFGQQPIKLVGTIFGGAKNTLSKLTGLDGSDGKHKDKPLDGLLPTDGLSQLGGAGSALGLDSLTNPTKLTGLSDGTPALDLLNKGGTGLDALNKAQDGAGKLSETALGSVGKIKPEDLLDPFKLY